MIKLSPEQDEQLKQWRDPKSRILPEGHNYPETERQEIVDLVNKYALMRFSAAMADDWEHAELFDRTARTILTLWNTKP